MALKGAAVLAAAVVVVVVSHYEFWTRSQTGISRINFLFRRKYVRKRMYTHVDS